MNQAVGVIEELYINDLKDIYYGGSLDSIYITQTNSYLNTIGPFTKLKWTPGTPYDGSVPVNCGRIPGGKAYAGCVPIVVAMVTAYMAPYFAVVENQVDKIRNMPRITINNKEESKIVADFVAKIGTLCQAEYDCNAGTGATMPNAARALSYFGVLYDYKDGNIDTKKAAASLIRYYPVIAAGYDGKNFPHAWMIEGGIERVSPGISSIDNFTHYYCNWGFDNGSDGFFAVGKHEDYIDPKGSIYRLVKSNRYIYVTGALRYY